MTPPILPWHREAASEIAEMYVLCDKDSDPALYDEIAEMIASHDPACAAEKALARGPMVRMALEDGTPVALFPIMARRFAVGQDITHGYTDYVVVSECMNQNGDESIVVRKTGSVHWRARADAAEGRLKEAVALVQDLLDSLGPESHSWKCNRPPLNKCMCGQEETEQRARLFLAQRGNKGETT